MFSLIVNIMDKELDLDFFAGLSFSTGSVLCWICVLSMSGFEICFKFKSPLCY